MIGAAQRDAGVVFAEILMLQNAHRKAVFLVEGDTDSRFWKKFFAREHYHLIAVGGKKTMLPLIAKLDQTKNKEVIALLDLDFDQILGRLTQSPRLAYTSAHDFETELVASPALDSLLLEFVTSPESLRKLEELRRSEGSLLNALLRRALLFAQLRLDNEFSKRQIDFAKTIPLIQYFDKDWQLDRDRLLENYADAANLTVDQLLQALVHLPDASQLELIQGHDLLLILTLALSRTIKANPKPLSGDDVMNMLRASADVAALRGTAMYQNLEIVRADMKLPELLR
jgi:Protein of unknown function (DUF4435)